ncbi:MAG TPA: hypothetical protein VGO51_15820 [Burkholderiaceae bacterium]|jgi:hypothetical protein|nr:hypothetical protein [Burkholderiaceae bacterium]
MMLTKEVSNLDTHTKSNYTNMAQLKELMTAPPMSAERHAAITRKRIQDRRMIEEAKDLKTEAADLY